MPKKDTAWSTQASRRMGGSTSREMVGIPTGGGAEHGPPTATNGHTDPSSCQRQPMSAPHLQVASRAPRAPQPLDLLAVDDAQLKLQTVCALVGIGRATVYKRVALGQFPKPIKHGPRCTRWRAGDVREWLRQSCQEGAANAS